MHLSGKYSINKVCSRRPVFQFLCFTVAVLYGFDLSQIFTPIILRLYQPHSLCEKGATRAATKAALYVFLLPPLREGRPLRPARRFPTPYFYSRPYARGDTISGGGAIPLPLFLLTPLREGRRLSTRQRVLLCQNFYSRPYARGDKYLIDRDRSTIYHFYSRPYARGDTRGMIYLYDNIKNISTRAPTRGATSLAAVLALFVFVFLLAPLREGRQQFFTKPQVDLYDKLLKIHIFQINTFCILQYSFENFKDYFVGSARTSRKNVYGKGWR